VAAHRYWALRCTAKDGSGNGVALSRLEFRASVGGTNLAVGGTASGLSGSGQTPSRAFDGDNATQWYYGASSSPARISYDFTTDVDVGAVWLRLPSAGTYNGNTYGPGFVHVEWSDDGTNWSTGTGLSATAGLGNDAEVEFAASDAAPPANLIGQIGWVQGFAPTWPAPVRTLDGPQMLRRVDYGGLGRVRGTVKIKGTPDAPVRRIVRLVREIDAVCVHQVFSDPITGEYEFQGFDPLQKYTVLSYDLPGGFRAAIASGVLPEPLPIP
jgi:hypothetical protein